MSTTLRDSDLLRSLHRTHEPRFSGALISSVTTNLSGLVTMDAGLTALGMPVEPFPTAGVQYLRSVQVLLAGSLTGSPVSVDLLVGQGIGGGALLPHVRSTVTLLRNEAGAPFSGFYTFDPPRPLIRLGEGSQQLHAACALNTGACSQVGILLEWSEAPVNTHPPLPWQS